MDREASKSKKIPSTEVQRRKHRIIRFRCYIHTQNLLTALVIGLQSFSREWGGKGGEQVIDIRGYPKKTWVKVTLQKGSWCGPGSRWGSRTEELNSLFPWQCACYWQSGFHGEVEQRAPHSRLRHEWTRTGGHSEGGQPFQGVWEELRMQNSIFIRTMSLVSWQA